jgi:tRNA pseudouridine55 synthase
MLLAVDKPIWITSYDVIRILKHRFKWQKIWHSGTLDPMATGLMIIWIWDGTKQLFKLQWLDKSYEAEIDFSKISDTRDLEYRKTINNLELKMNNEKCVWLFVNEKLISKPDLKLIKKELDKLIPEYSLPLSWFSAKKVWWKKFYELAREWDIKQENRVMKINSYQILDYNFPLLKVKLDVWSWTYIRSIAYWLGQQLWLGGILSALRRTSVGNFEIEKMEMKVLEGSDLKVGEIYFK